LDYLAAKGTSIEWINTHTLCSWGANALFLSGFSEMDIQKMGRWLSATFLEYVWEELACFLAGMSTEMHLKFGFVNVAGGVFTNATNELCNSPYFTNVSDSGT
jgi:hypothetical protein